jgi:hypothetical protein
MKCSSHFQFIFLVLCLVLNACAHKMPDRLFLINPEKDYPEFNIPLCDIFDVKVIHLEGEEQNFFIRHILGRNLYLDEKNQQILLINGFIGHLSSIGVFDFNGHFIRSIGRVGGGPAEFCSDYIAFLPIPEKEQVLVIDYYDGKFICYDYNGNYMKTQRFDEQLYTYEWASIANKLLAYDINNPQMESTLSLFDLDSLRPIGNRSFHFSRPYDTAGYLKYKVYSTGTVCSENGIWLNPDSCSDTTYFFQHDGRIVPRIVNLAHNTAEHILSLVFESPEYLFCRYRNAEHWEKCFVIHKSDGEIFKISPQQLSFLTFYFWNATRDGRHCILPMSEILYPDELIALDPDAKPLIESFDEEGNPLLVIFTLK